MSKIQSNREKTKVNFSKNIIVSIVIPAILIIATLIVGLVFGFNKGVDFNGGINVSVVAENLNLETSEDYNSFKGDVDKIIKYNGVSGTIYMVETDSVTYDNVLVVKIHFNGNETEAQKIVEGIKEGLITKFFSGLEANEIENRNLVRVSTFGSSVSSYTILASVLATIVMVIAICVYMGLRNLSLHTAVLGFTSAVLSSFLMISLIMIDRIQINAYSLALLPLTSVLSMIITFIFIQKANKMSKSDKYERKSNFVLAEDVVKSNIAKTAVIGGIALVVCLAFIFANITSNVVFLGLGVLSALLGAIYTNLTIIPFIYALTYVRRIKKEKQRKENKTEKLSETEVLKETDLDNLVSN